MSARIGVLGGGRLGRALALRLRADAEVTVADVEPKRTKQFTKLHGLRFVYPESLGGHCDVVVVCVPPDRVADAFRGLAAQPPPRPLCLNAATSVSTADLRADPALSGLRIAGLKPVGQHTALRHGLPAVLVTGDPEHLPLLRDAFGGLGEVVLGDEDVVGPLNRAATLAALRACEELAEAAAELAVEPALLASAARNVLAGTALDYPPDPANPYLADLLAQLARRVPTGVAP